MGSYDIVMAVILVAALLHGAWRGMASQLAPIVALVLGYVVAFPLSSQTAHWFGDNAPSNQMVALVVIYLTVALGVFYLAHLAKTLIQSWKLQGFDHHVGFLLGGLKGTLVCLVVTFCLVGLSSQARESILPTRSGHLAALIIDKLHPVMPEAVHDLLHPHVHSLDETLGDDHYHHGEGDHAAHSSEPVGHDEPAAADQILPDRANQARQLYDRITK